MVEHRFEVLDVFHLESIVCCSPVCIVREGAL